MQAMESQFDVCTEDLFNQTIKLEEMEKKACAKLPWNWQALARELMLLLRRELNLRMRFHQMKKPLTTLTNNWK